jgi:hypothetical protein
MLNIFQEKLHFSLKNYIKIRNCQNLINILMFFFFFCVKNKTLIQSHIQERKNTNLQFVT